MRSDTIPDPTPHPTERTYALDVKVTLIERRTTQRELGRVLGVTESAISKALIGKNMYLLGRIRQHLQSTATPVVVEK
jgi:transcriptional regulator with XRE-family HTH domain